MSWFIFGLVFSPTGHQTGGNQQPHTLLNLYWWSHQNLTRFRLWSMFFDKSFICSTNADDMRLVSFSKKGLDMMMNVCYEYSCRWRFNYNHKSELWLYLTKMLKIIRQIQESGNFVIKIVSEKDKYVHFGYNM